MIHPSPPPLTPLILSERGAKVGEIVAVETTAFTAQSYELNGAPAFGSLLRVHVSSRPAYWALCYEARTGSIEPGRHAVAWGHAEDDEDDVYRRQPQLSQVLRTTFDALLVGYDADDNGGDGERGAPIQRVPATTPRLHAAVYQATDAETARFNRDLTYLRFVLRSDVPNADDFIAAVIEGAYVALGRDRAFLVTAARLVARLLGAEHERMMNILELLDRV